MNWQEVCLDSTLQDLPFKIELNQWGQIVMSPVKVIHSILQGEIQRKIYAMLNKGMVVPECAIRTSKGTKAADVAWLSEERLEIVKNHVQCSIAPEICVEVLSESNSEHEMIEKRKLYFEAGAKEVWICDEQGNIQFYLPQGKIHDSLLIKGFPDKITV